MVLTRYKDGRIHFRNSGMTGLNVRTVVERTEVAYRNVIYQSITIIVNPPEFLKWTLPSLNLELFTNENRMVESKKRKKEKKEATTTTKKKKKKQKKNKKKTNKKTNKNKTKKKPKTKKKTKTKQNKKQTNKKYKQTTE